MNLSDGVELGNRLVEMTSFSNFIEQFVDVEFRREIRQAIETKRLPENRKQIVIVDRNKMPISAFSAVSNVDNFRLQVDSDVVSGVVVDPTGVKIPVKFGDSRSNRSRNIRLPHFATNDNDDDAGRRTL